MSVEDEMFRVAGTLTLDDAKALLFGKTVTEQINDAEFRWLGEVPRNGVGATIEDRWKTIAIHGGANKHVNDIKLAYWKAQPSA